MEKSTSQPPGAGWKRHRFSIVRNGPGELRNTLDVHGKLRRVQRHAAAEGFVNSLVAGRHVGHEDVLAVLPLACVHDQSLAQRQELRIALHVGHQIEHLARRERQAAVGAE